MPIQSERQASSNYNSGTVDLRARCLIIVLPLVVFEQCYRDDDDSCMTNKSGRGISSTAQQLPLALDPLSFSNRPHTISMVFIIGCPNTTRLHLLSKQSFDPWSS